MGFFDFLKDLDIKAPEPEPQRGTVIQTDDSGRIATTPIGTPDRPVSRIISRDEFRDMQDTSQGRSFEQAQEDLAPEQKMLALSRQPTTPVGIRSFGPPSARANVPDVMGGFRQGDVTVNQATGMDLFRDMDAQRRRQMYPMPSPQEQAQMAQGYEDAFTPRDEIMTRLAVGNPREKKIYNLASAFLNDDSRLDTEDAITMAMDQVNREEYLANVQAFSPRSDKTFVPEFDRDNEGLDPNDQQALFFADPTFPQSALFGARLKNPNELFQEENRSQANLSQLGSKTGGISTFADAKKEIEEGKSGGIKDLNFLQKVMAVARNPIGRIMGYETDDKGMLTMKGLADMEADKQRSQAIYAEGQRQRNLDRDRAMRKAQMQQQQAPVVEEEEEEKRKFFQRNPMSMQAYLNQFRPAGMTGDVPLTMYGQLGGEYKYFMSDGGTSDVPRGDTGEVTGAGGPKDDLVGPFMLSNKEYVLPNEQIKMYGGGNYETGVKRLERDRMNALRNFA